MMKLKYLVLFLLSTFGLASPQIPELLIYKNDTIPIYNLIIEEYFQKNEKRTGKNRFEQLGVKDLIGGTFVAGRGYQGVYKIENDSLFIVDMISHSVYLSEKNETVEINAIKSLFKEKYKNGKVFVDWFSGDIAIRNGNLLRWDGIFVKSFEKEKLLSIKKGILFSAIDVQNYIDEHHKLNRRYNDSISTILFDKLRQNKFDNQRLYDYDCDENYLITINKKGRISKVIMRDYQTKSEIRDLWKKREYNYCIKEIKRRLNDVEFDVIKHNGKNIEETIWLNIWVNENGTLQNWSH